MRLSVWRKRATRNRLTELERKIGEPKKFLPSRSDMSGAERDMDLQDAVQRIAVEMPSSAYKASGLYRFEQDCWIEISLLS